MSESIIDKRVLFCACVKYWNIKMYPSKHFKQTEKKVILFTRATNNRLNIDLDMDRIGSN